ncbi:hypothetical protein [Thermoactinomyces sp. CICC 10523]|uniref:hypothetical protein n=1 Tax=Thermoactinomyces sp. CICC 10523 TaxID=2767428 RepID=UPI0018DC5F6F|nr:hypothetical protein [Thermoactinomyces sp. CICC 10523]MBH8599597.1 hypothetical protein [Thermoactinomyces sp. CICC 10523]
MVDTLSAIWDWMMEHKGITIAILSIIGIIVAIVGFVFEVGLAVLVGVGALVGEIVSALISWLSGSGWLSDEMLRDIIIGGIAGGISGLAGFFAEFLIGETGVVAWIGSRIPWLGRAFPKMFGGAVMGGADQSITDYLKTGKVNLKKAMVAAAFGFFLSFGGKYISSHLDGLITKINSFSLSPVMQVFEDGTASAPKTIGDTSFGQWLQKFATDNTTDSLISIEKQPRGKFFLAKNGKRISGRYYVTKNGAKIKQGQIVEVNNIPKYRPATGKVDLNYVAKVRKELGLLTTAEEQVLVKKKILSSESTVAVLESDGVQIWGRSSWGEDVEGGFNSVKKEWFEGRPGRTGKKYNERVEIAKEGERFKATNDATMTHAEGDVFWHLYLYRKEHKIIGGKATLYVDRPLCNYCDISKGVQNLVEEVGLDELIVVTPEGRRIIEPDPNFKRKSW